MVNAISGLNKAQYGGLDFDTHFDDLLARLQVEFAADFNDFALSSLGIVLLDLTSYGLDTLSFYLDRRATDNFLETARTRKSISRLTRQLGYKMSAAVASSVDLEVAITVPVAFSVTVPALFQFEGPDGLIFEAARSVTFSPGAGASSPQTIPCYEGETIVESFVSDGTANQVFELSRVPDNKFVVAGTVSTLVDGSAFTESEFMTFDATDQFEVGYNDDPTTIRFGDGTAGNIPTEGASIDVTYVASSGVNGLVQANTITDVVTPLVVSFQQISLSVTNSNPSVGGSDPESLESAKANAPQVFKSRDVAITRNDYVALAGSFSDPLFGRVAVAQAISSRSGGTDLTLQNYLQDIIDAVGLVAPTITAAVTAGEAQLDVIDDNSTMGTGSNNISDKLDDTATLLSSISDQATTALVATRSSQANTSDLTTASAEITTRSSNTSSEVTSADGSVTSALNTINAITDTTDDSLTTATKTSIVNSLTAAKQDLSDAVSQLTALDTQNATISGLVGTLDSNLGAILTALNQISSDSSDVGTDLVTSGTLLEQLSTLNAGIQTASTSTRAEFANITNAQVVVVNDVEAATDGISTHVGSFLSADCKANLVTVPILTVNQGGFFAAPSLSLIQSLQEYLDARKEVTQTVSVTSGERFLVPAVITVRVGVSAGYAQNVIKNAVEASIDTVLRGRRFGESLFESELDAAIEDIDGISYWNVAINGHYDSSTGLTSSSKLDEDGNLILSIGEIITKADFRNTVLSPSILGVLVNTETALTPSGN